ncbi:hypothetical protein TanjilG_02278 [Lupinus angustifolius]|uniref:SKP1-like protein n=1 Tax=Lupinus angustifolius TaxID=3871 RepID=A0A4P1QQJ4_LUPAN|nr:PREDICTED: SKP1-like protein 14 [Lupinus angustifolius]OIV92515.1 hypothetical protein TanjilG_02278 [Lupinus angustifolius]
MAEPNLPLISLKTADGETFNVSPIIAKHMEIVQNFIGDDSSVSVTSSVVPLPNVNASELSKIIDYLDYHHNFRKGVDSNDEEAKEFDEKFTKGLSHDELKMLLIAANYLNVKELLELLFQTIADIIENKSVEYVRNFFGIVSTYTPEEEEELRQQHRWAFEGVDED